MILKCCLSLILNDLFNVFLQGFATRQTWAEVVGVVCLGSHLKAVCCESGIVSHLKARSPALDISQHCWRLHEEQCHSQNNNSAIYVMTIGRENDLDSQEIDHLLSCHFWEIFGNASPIMQTQR
jgi:hypothetical protein